MEGKRFSTSRHYAVWLPDVLSRYDPAPLRYFLIAGGPETADTDFTWAEFVRRNNDEMVATRGNLAHRLLTFVHRHFGAVPEPGAGVHRVLTCRPATWSGRWEPTHLPPGNRCGRRSRCSKSWIPS